MERHGSPGAVLAVLSLLVFARCADAVTPPSVHRCSTQNFYIDVNGPVASDAEQIGQQAEEYRRQIAMTWLGRELPASARRCLIHVTIDDSRSRGQTFPGPAGAGSLIWLTASRDEVMGPLLAHEIAHTVLAHRFGDAMPAWANEGIASCYDGVQRKQVLRHALTTVVAEQRWRDLSELMSSNVRTPETYAVAASLTGMLLERGTPRDFIRFIELGMQASWDQALRRQYGIENLAALQHAWQHWARPIVENEPFSLTPATASRKGRRSFVAHRSQTSSRP